VIAVTSVVDEAAAMDSLGEAIEMYVESCGDVHFDDPGTARLTAEKVRDACSHVKRNMPGTHCWSAR
jgi:hypothetical protein